jgi:hypothetical protein
MIFYLIRHYRGFVKPGKADPGENDRRDAGCPLVGGLQPAAVTVK